MQSELIDLLAEGHGNLMVVGDDAQSIYSWRGADYRNILEFPDRYEGAKVYKIETNYRSVPEVLALANESIRNNVNQFPKELVAARDSRGMRPGLIPLPDPRTQANFVSQRIRELHEEEGIEYEDMAVLYRSHFHSMEVQMQLTVDGVPFIVTSGLRFFEQAHIKDVAAFLKFASNPTDETFLRPHGQSALRGRCSHRCQALAPVARVSRRERGRAAGLVFEVHARF